ncbi:MAG: M10 family metallopeptidase C-terminal domain-containing protein [Gammaproteobacteria bacterium]|nr:M10 family metallopeptidase C-terminal domain-containing protein [Gammaproteobacteria bacterium]MDE0284328.1 M10 family metallopeptidase C-terminal domain-containing protein [Gammaproteobacteria bacterium]MDE0511524.1 M10 family metallopeptidase C-terminal domain-containing protein [Gammaproteobacteria bacterium]
MELVDLDGDGDLDVVEIDAHGYYITENTGTRYDPEFGLDTHHVPGDWSWVKTYEFVDVDSDGDFDIVGADYFGGLYYFENTGTNRVPSYPGYIYLANPLDAALYSAIIPEGLLKDFAFVDLDGDNDMDFFSLDTYGDVYYFENRSTPNLLHFEPTSFHKKTTFTLYDTDGYDTLDLRSDSSNQAIDINPLGVSNIYGLTGNVIIGPDTYIERVYAGSGNDLIIGNRVANRIYGMDGNDFIKGNEGNDSLVGGGGNDLISGGPGNDWIYGRNDNDQLHGGHGNDTFIFGENEGNDWIADFGNGNDRLHVAAFDTIQSIEDITLSRSGNNTIVDLSAHGGGIITLENFTDTLDASDFYFG